MKVLITGTAGFIGFHLAKKLSSLNYEVTGMDMINSYYDINLKYDRLKNAGFEKDRIRDNELINSSVHSTEKFIKADLTDRDVVFRVFEQTKPDIVVNLAAQAGVRYSLTHPQVYIDSNITGFLNILEASRAYPVKHLLYASSSSVYGLNKNMPFSVHKNVDHPVSLYAATKKSNELMAHTYSHLFQIPTTGLRFFTVYGPWGRPDMALFIFTKAILMGEPIEVFNYGNMERDFTYIDDIVSGIEKMLDKPPASLETWNPENPDPSCSSAPYRVFNIGNNKPVKLLDFIKAIEKKTGKKAIMNMQAIQPGDVEKTWADVQELIDEFHYKPSTPVEAGISDFVDWFRSYYT